MSFWAVIVDKIRVADESCCSNQYWLRDVGGLFYHPFYIF